MDWRETLRNSYALDDGQISAFETLLAMLQARNDRNLTAVTGEDGIVRLHFLDSLSLLEIPELKNAASIADIGSGAGFPGLPLAIARPQARVTMIEAIGKKSDFISSAVSELGLINATVLPVRAEDAARSPLRDSFDAAVARAVGSLPEVLEYTLPLVRAGGHALLQRGVRESGDEELAGRAAAELGGSLCRVEAATPYPEARNLHVWILRKTESTPDKYPRRPGMARKRPLGQI